MRDLESDPAAGRARAWRFAGVIAALLGLCFAGVAHAQDDCAAKRKALKAAERKAAALQNKLRKLLTKGTLSDAEKASLTKTQDALGPAGEKVDQLEAAAKGCTPAAKPKTVKTPKKPKKPKKPVAEKKPKPQPKVVAKPEPPKPEPPKPEPPKPAVATPTPAAASPATAVDAPPSSCSGGPRAWSLSSAGEHVHAPPNVARYERENARRQHRKRAVRWALEMPHRCAPRAR